MYYQCFFQTHFLTTLRVIRMRVVTVHLPEAYLEAIDELVRRRLYPNRAEAIRMAVRDFIKEEARTSE